MNKKDFLLIIVVIIIISIMFIFTNMTKEKGDTAEVYYEDKLILQIDLNIDKEYTVQGFLGDVVIEVKDKKVRVKKENSPQHICSKEGFISDSSKALICLPNKIVIKIVGTSELDGVVY